MARYFALAKNGFITWNCFSWWGEHTKKIRSTWAQKGGCVYVNGYIFTASTFHSYYISFPSQKKKNKIRNWVCIIPTRHITTEVTSFCKCGYACFYKQNVLQVVRCSQLCLLNFFITKFRFVFKLKSRTCKTCNLVLVPEKFN